VDERSQAIERLYRERYVNFRNAMATVTGNYETAKDAVQEGFARALRKRRQFRGEGSLEAWVWRIVLRAALESPRGREAPLGELPEAEFVEPNRDPALTAALRTLSPRRRLIVFLHYYADLPYAEIADVCGISEGTVAATLAQARMSLIEVLEREKSYEH
jgi:RNA polymerase sigma factor (sigma-70 family)